MKMKEKTPITFYQVAENVISDDTFEEAVYRIMRIVNSESERYILQRPSRDDFGEFNVKIYHSKKLSIPQWRNVISKLVSEDAPIAKCERLSPSFILFVGYKKRIFAVTGGTGSFEIDQFVSQTFGMDVITRLIDKHTPVVRSLQNRGLTGVVLGQRKNFRTDRRIAEEKQFGQIYNEVSAQLNKKILTSVFGFKGADLKRDVSGCLAKSSFRINKSLDENDLFKVISKLDGLLDKPAKFSLNSVELISRRKSHMLIPKLEEALLHTLYSRCQNNEEPDFDFTHKNIDKYFQAACYTISIGKDIIKFDNPPTLLEVQRKVAAKGRLLTDHEYEFKHSLLSLKVESMDEEGNVLTHGSVQSHLHGEVFYDGHSYFIVDGEWYRVSHKFINELNSDLHELLHQYWDETIITAPFDIKMDEGDYNASFIGQPGIFVLDAITPENIELCDLLKYDANSLYLLHIKKGFNNMIRNLASQVLIAAKRLQNDIKSGLTYIKQVENAAKKGKRSNSKLMRKLAEQAFPPGGLSTLFEEKRDKDVCFCLAFVDTADKPRNLKDSITSFRSNIAKYALLELIKEIKAMGFDFRVIQLNKKEEKPNTKEVA